MFARFTILLVKAKKKGIKMQRHRISCGTLPDGHLKFECSILHSNVHFYFKCDKYSKFEFVFANTVNIYFFIF